MGAYHNWATNEDTDTERGTSSGFNEFVRAEDDSWGLEATAPTSLKECLVTPLPVRAQ